MKKALIVAIAAVSFSSLPVFAQTGNMHDGNMNMSMGKDGAAMHGKMSEGTIKKLDKSAGKVTIAHGPLENLGMPPMTMTFKVKTPAQLNPLKAGDKVRFVAADVGGDLTVTEIQPAK